MELLKTILLGRIHITPHPKKCFIGFCSSSVALLVTQFCPTVWDPTTVAHQAPLSIGLSRKECWSGLPFPSPEDLPDPGIEPRSPALQADSLLSVPPEKSLFSTEADTKKWGMLERVGVLEPDRFLVLIHGRCSVTDS